MNRSRPFDFGTTTQLAFGYVDEDEKMVSTVEENARTFSIKSQANGSLMRAIPIAIWYYDLGYDQIAEYAKEDAKFSHPNIICQECNAVYCITVAFLINNPKHSHSALTIAEEYVRERCCNTVQEWFYESLQDNLLSIIDCTKHIGHIKHAFQLTFHFLFNETSFEESLFKTLLQGGDTDTNAAIVCGMMGAFHGEIPQNLLDPVMKYDCCKEGRKRPIDYSVKKMVDKLQKK
jgi:ADP-ribosylglycohydrolase